MAISKIHGRFHFSCILPHFGTIFGEKRALGPPRATLGGSRAVPWASAGALGRLPGRSGRPFWVKKWFLENVHAVEAPGVFPRGSGRPVAAPCSSSVVRDVPRRLRNVLRGKGEVQKIKKFRKMHQILEFSWKNADFHEN